MDNGGDYNSLLHFVQLSKKTPNTKKVYSEFNSMSCVIVMHILYKIDMLIFTRILLFQGAELLRRAITLKVISEKKYIFKL